MQNPDGCGAATPGCDAALLRHQPGASLAGGGTWHVRAGLSRCPTLPNAAYCSGTGMYTVWPLRLISSTGLRLSF